MLLNEQVFQLRHPGRPSVLDRRGELAEILSERLGLTDWSLDDKQVSVRNSSSSERAVVGVNSVSFALQECDRPEEIAETVKDFLNAYLSVIHTGSSGWVCERIGVRVRFCSSYEGRFTVLRDTLNEKYSQLSSAAEDALQAEMVDYAAQHEFRDTVGDFHLKLGPMEQDQIQRYFPNRSDYPDVGFYSDTDYRDAKTQERTLKQVVSYVARASTSAWERHSRLVTLIG